MSFLKEIENKITISKSEKKQESNKWKYKYDDSSDLLQIPIIEFNLEKDFEKLINKKVICDNRNFNTTKIYQRNQFFLNEKGAVIESIAIATDASAKRPSETPKKFILDNDFVLVVSKTSNKEPYFMSIIQNSELMKTF